MMSRELLESYSVLTLVNLANRRKTNAMGFLQIRSRATAFYIWKKKAKIEFSQAYDSQVRLHKLQALAELVTRQQQIGLAHFFNRARLGALEKSTRKLAITAVAGRPARMDRVSKCRVVASVYIALRKKHAMLRRLRSIKRWKLLVQTRRQLDDASLRQRPDPRKISFRRKWQQAESAEDAADRQKYVGTAARLMAVATRVFQPCKSSGRFGYLSC